MRTRNVTAPGKLSRRGFLGGVGGAAAALTSIAAEAPATSKPSTGGLPHGAPLRVLPLLVYQIPVRRERTSWRPYGGLKSREDVAAEARRIKDELAALCGRAEFPVEVLPLAMVGNDAEAEAGARAECDALLVFASGGAQHWLERLAASGKPNIWFLRHRSGPFYLWYEIAHWRFLRKNEDTIKEEHMDAGDIVVDEYDDVLWRLRALYGLKNARGTTSLAVGGLAAYSEPGQRLGPAHAKDVWGYTITPVADAELVAALAAARNDRNVMQKAEAQAAELLAQPGVTLKTERRFVVNTFLAVHVLKELMAAAGAANLGVAHCMGGLIGQLDTPPCLALSLLNDEGYTAFCHTDYTHTPPGVLLRWISGKPSFVNNSHFPHHGIVTLAHCAAPRRMNGKDFEPAEIPTHFESDYGAATKVEYRKGQALTVIIPNLTCTKWFAFRAEVLDSPAYDICRSQMDVTIDGDWRRLLAGMQGFHTVTCYGDYLREVAYALKRTGIAWENVSKEA